MSDVDNSGVEDPKDEEDGKDAASAPSGAPSTEGPPMTLLFPQPLSSNTRRISGCLAYWELNSSLCKQSAVISGSR
jgi:hypothetical protein